MTDKLREALQAYRARYLVPGHVSDGTIKSTNEWQDWWAAWEAACAPSHQTLHEFIESLLEKVLHYWRHESECKGEMQVLGVPDDADAPGISVGDLRQILKLATLQSAAPQEGKADVCSACAGTGTPVSGLKCICKGTGSREYELVGLREYIMELEDQLTTLRVTHRQATTQPAAIPDGFQPLETVRYYAESFAKTPDQIGGGMIAKLLQEYAQLRAMLAASPSPPEAVGRVDKPKSHLIGWATLYETTGGNDDGKN